MVRASRPAGTGAFHCCSVSDAPMPARITYSACAAESASSKPLARSASRNFANPCRAGGASSPSVTTATWRAAMAGSASRNSATIARSLRMPRVYAYSPRGGASCYSTVGWYVAMVCPQCRARYREGVVECSECHITLVDRLDDDLDVLVQTGINNPIAIGLAASLLRSEEHTS